MPNSEQIRMPYLPIGQGARFLKHNQHGLVALEKPAGLMSHPNRSRDFGRSLLNAEYDQKNEFYAWKTSGGIQRAWLLNRLDSPTSGVLLLSVNESIVQVIRQLFAVHKVKKTYYALVKGKPSPASGCWKDILKRESYKQAKVSGSASELFAQTYYQFDGRSEDLPVSLIRLMPVTGRAHQLRIQCSYHNHPIIGDRTHGDFSFNRKLSSIIGEKRMMLHSAEINLSYMLQGNQYKFKAESLLPKVFTRSIEKRQ